MTERFEHFKNWYRSNKENILAEAEQGVSWNIKLREEFLKEWPLEKLLTMNIDEYVMGKGSANKSLCYEIEAGKYSKLFLSISGGSSGKFKLYWSNNKQGYCNSNNEVIPNNLLDSYFSQVKNDLYNIVKAVIDNDFSSEQFSSKNMFFKSPSIVTKLACIYSEDRSYTGINMNRFEERDLWFSFLNKEKTANIYKDNYDLTTLISKEYNELDGYYLSSILWAYKDKVQEEVKKGIDIMNAIDNYTNYLKSAKNLILRGAPGTGKTYLANQIASYLVSDGRTNKKEELSDDERTRIGFVQFHPSYDYTDFVEGLRPTLTDDGVVGFELKAGSFKTFVERAIKGNDIVGNDNFDECWERLINDINESDGKYEMIGTDVEITLNSQNNIRFKSPVTTKENVYELYINGTTKLKYEYYHKKVLEHMFNKYGLNKVEKIENNTDSKNYVFIIDEINRGEISKIFGELFYSIDPGYRGVKDGVYTQYANLHSNPDEKFYIPENVYIIGTMNDIDRSVDSFDFAMRRRFTFVEVTAEQSATAMGIEGEVYDVMHRLNNAIVDKEIGGLTTDYQIGASYFKDVNNLQELWEYKLYPLLSDYFKGERNAKTKLDQLADIYFERGDLDE